jgi:hypothetical protein
MFIIIIVICLMLQLQLMYCDQTFYSDTNAESIPDLYNLNNYKKMMQLKVTTSNKYLADTTDNVYITLIGEFASSGPHSLGPQIKRGATVDSTIILNRIIGRLNSVLFEKKGSDGWLLSGLTCTMDGVQYEIGIQQQWLSDFDQINGELYNGNGYEPKAHEDLTELPASSTLQLPVARIVKLYTSTSAVSDSF